MDSFVCPAMVRWTYSKVLSKRRYKLMFQRLEDAIVQVQGHRNGLPIRDQGQNRTGTYEGDRGACCLRSQDEGRSAGHDEEDQGSHQTLIDNI